MTTQLAVVGAGSLIGKHLCKRAVRLGWDVNAFSMFDCYTSSGNYRNRGLYESHFAWQQHLSWNVSVDYDTNFEALHNEIRNATGVVYIYEPTVAMTAKTKTGKASANPMHHQFEANAMALAKLCGDWSVRHFIAVSNTVDWNSSTSSNEFDLSPWLIVSLLKTGYIYSYDEYRTCLKVFKNRTIKSIGFDVKPIESAMNAETVAKCITTLIHNTNDPNIYRIMNNIEMEQYLADADVPFDSPNDEKNVADDIENNDNKDHTNAIKSSSSSSSQQLPPKFYKYSNITEKKQKKMM